MIQTKVKPIIGRVGGKVRLAPWIIQHLTRVQWSIYCETETIEAQALQRILGYNTITGQCYQHPRHGTPSISRNAMDILAGLESRKYRLGTLCKRGHDWDGTGQSVRVVRKNGWVADCVECRNDRCNKYYADNKESFLEDCRRRYYENHEANLEYRKRWYQSVRQDPVRYARHLEISREQHKKHREHEREYQRDWYNRNPEKAKAKHDRWRKAHPEIDAERLRRNGLRRKARKRSAHSVNISQSVFDSKLQAFSGKCAYCLSILDVVTWDHFIPLAGGGSHVESNLVPCCASCNSSKCDRDPIDWFRSKPFWNKSRESKVLRHLGKTLKNYNQVPLL